VEIKFKEMVADLIKPGADIVNSLTVEKANIWHLATGVSGEAGELLDAIKKHVIYNKPLDRENIVEELGDLMFYMEGLMQALNISGEECISANIEKLGVRYSSGKYSNEQAQARADKEEK